MITETRVERTERLLAQAPPDNTLQPCAFCGRPLERDHSLFCRPLAAQISSDSDEDDESEEA